jgi:hypothetical protein
MTTTGKKWNDRWWSLVKAEQVKDEVRKRAAKKAARRKKQR